MDSFHYVFQLSKKIVFEVNYYLLDNNNNKHYTTSAAEFNQPKTDYRQCGQAQKELLKSFPLALNFYRRFDELHIKDLTESQYDEILIGLDKLKYAYNFLYSNNDRGFNFSTVKEFSKSKVK